MECGIVHEVFATFRSICICTVYLLGGGRIDGDIYLEFRPLCGEVILRSTSSLFALLIQQCPLLVWVIA